MLQLNCVYIYEKDASTGKPEQTCSSVDGLYSGISMTICQLSIYKSESRTTVYQLISMNDT